MQEACHGRTAYTCVQQAFWIIAFPGAFLALTVLAINLLGDGLRNGSRPGESRHSRQRDIALPY